MLLLAHTGITLGTAALLAGAAGLGKKSGNGILTWFASLAEYMDIRVLLVGSMLPDIIDKPVGMFFFRDTFSNGRIFSHTLLFVAVLAAAGFYLYRWRRRTWLLVLAFGSLCHLILDGIWNTPQTVLWPLLGFAFDRIDLEGWSSFWYRDLFDYPELYIPEMVGLAVLLWFGFTLIRRRKAGAFLRYGRG